jgi:hypothetical protein
VHDQAVNFHTFLIIEERGTSSSDDLLSDILDNAISWGLKAEQFLCFLF